MLSKNKKTRYNRKKFVIINTQTGVDIQGNSGSCLAAAITAGAAAQFLEWAVIQKNASGVNSVDVKNYFIRGAKREIDQVYPNREWGFGRLNIKGVFDALTNR